MPSQNPLEAELARLMVATLNLDARPEAIDPGAPLYQQGLGLDSIDLLELSVAVAKQYGFQIRSEDPGITQIFSSLGALSGAVASRRTL